MWSMYIYMDVHTYSEYLLICHKFVFKEYGGLMSLADQLDIHWYLYIILVLGNGDGLKV